MVADVKMKGFWCRDSLVAGGNVTDPPVTITYLSKVSRETVSIDVTLDALNELPVKVEDIHNA